MMNDDSVAKLFAIITLALIVVCIILVVYSEQLNGRISKMKKESIELGYAQYSPKTGEWEWINNTVNDKDK